MMAMATMYANVDGMATRNYHLVVGVVVCRQHFVYSDDLQPVAAAPSLEDLGKVLDAPPPGGACPTSQPIDAYHAVAGESIVAAPGVWSATASRAATAASESQLNRGAGAVARRRRARPGNGNVSCLRGMAASLRRHRKRWALCDRVRATVQHT